MDAVRPQRIDRDGGRDGGIDATRQAEHDAREAVLVHVVAQAERHRAIDLAEPVGRARDLARRADQAIALAPPFGQHNAFLEHRQQLDQRAVWVQHEGGAVEDDLVLPAHLAKEDEGQAGFNDARNRQRQALAVVLVGLEGGAIDGQQHLRAGLAQRLGDGR
jgi:hypothetical protein